MKLNKYLKELGLTQMDMPNYYNKRLANKAKYESKPGADPRNKEDDEGFSIYEFFNLDYTLSLMVYSKLCYYREHIADIVTPGCLTGVRDERKLTEEEKEEPHKKWIEIVDKMVEGFRISIEGTAEGKEGIETYKIHEARHLLAEFWDYLWY